MITELRSNTVNSAIFWAKSHSTNGADWSEDTDSITHKSVFGSKTQFDPVKLHVHVLIV